jgi:hypothetical protein
MFVATRQLFFIFIFIFLLRYFYANDYYIFLIPYIVLAPVVAANQQIIVKWPNLEPG